MALGDTPTTSADSLDDEVALEDEDCKLPGALCDAFSQIWFLDKQAASKLQAYEETGEDEE